MKPRWALILGLSCCCAQAAERVLDFHSEIRVRGNGDLAVTELITVQTEVRDVRAGLHRLLTARRAEVVSVSRNGAPEPYTLERTAEGLRLYAGAPGVLQPPGVHEYRIVYRAAREAGFRGRADELTWDVNGGAWRMPIERLSVEVRLPEPVPADSLKVDARTGEQGRHFQAFVRPGSAAFRITRPLAPGESFRIAVGLPQGVVAPPSRAQRFDAWAEGNPLVLAGLAALLALGFWYQLRIRTSG